MFPAVYKSVSYPKYSSSIAMLFKHLAILCLSISISLEENNNKKSRVTQTSRSEIKTKIVSVLSMLQRNISRNANQSKAGKLKPCSFSFDEVNLEDGGICTHYGACRFHGADYMYQGGCGDLSIWGTLPITKPMVCSMMVTRSRLVTGKCTKSGHCWAGYHIKLLHAKCS